MDKVYIFSPHFIDLNQQTITLLLSYTNNVYYNIFLIYMYQNSSNLKRITKYSHNRNDKNTIFSVHPSLVKVYNQLNENERSSYYPAIQSASSVKKNHYNHYKRSHTQFTEREEDSVWATRGRKTDSLPCIYVLCSPLFLTKMSLGTLTFERKELSENEMIYGLTILKFVEK